MRKRRITFIFSSRKCESSKSERNHLKNKGAGPVSFTKQGAAQLFNNKKQSKTGLSQMEMACGLYVDASRQMEMAWGHYFSERFLLVTACVENKLISPQMRMGHFK